MTVKFDKLAETLGLDPSVKEQITEAWSSKLKEARQEITAELREEFAQKFEHDKAKLVKSMDHFLTERVNAEIDEFAQDKKALAEDRVNFRRMISKQSKLVESFINKTVSKEIQELREDRKHSQSNIKKLEEFVLKQLAGEVQELHEDRQGLAKQRVKLIREHKQTLAESKQNFVKKAAKTLEENLNKMVYTEIAQYRNDIDRARRNDFGRRIFEAFVGEYMTSHLNESSEVKQIQTQMNKLAKKLEESQSQITQREQLLEQAKVKLNAAKDMIGREKMLSEMMAPLSKRQKAIMEELLEHVKTNKLQESFDRYLPAVLNENNTHTQTKQKLSEGVRRTAKTGDRSASAEQAATKADFELEINQLRKLAGIGQ